MVMAVTERQQGVLVGALNLTGTSVAKTLELEADVYHVARP